MSSERPRILRLTPVLDFGGVESRLVTQSGLMDQSVLDYRVCTFWKHGAAARAVEANGVQVDELGVDPSPKNRRALARLTEYVFDTRVDVVHASIVEANFHAALMRAIPGAPSVAIEEVGKLQRSVAARAVFGAVYRQADVVIGVSSRTCDALRSEHWLSASKVRLIYNSINPRFLTLPTVSPEHSPLRLLAVGRLVEVKNHQSVLEGLARIAPSQRPRLDIVGEGPLRQDLEASIQRLRLEDSVHLLGYRDDVVQLLDACDAYVISSFSEGTSISLAEAMARARPVVASKAEGVNEAMEGYPGGWQVAPTDMAGWADAFRRLSELSADERRALGRQARATIEQRMSPTRWKAQLEALYLELAERARVRRSRWRSRGGSAVARRAVGLFR
jgi:glycosyltransferase involved in cell wall biosynthesis